MWDLIVSVPDHCLSFYFSKAPRLKQIKTKLIHHILMKVYAN